VFPKREAVITSYNDLQFAGGRPVGQHIAGHDRRRSEVATVSIGEVGELHLPFFLAGLLVKRTK
jgi:hypothetical protein